MQRVKFTFNKKPRNKLLDDLSLYNSRLRELFESSDRLAMTRQRRRTTNAGANLSNFWQHAKNIYCLLKKAWCCECSSSHHANLLLQARDTTPDVELRISLLYSSDINVREAAPWVMRKTTIKPVNEEIAESLTVPPSPMQPPSPSRSLSKSPLRPSLSIRTSARIPKGGVRWAAPTSPAPTSPAPTSPSSLLDSKRDESAADIFDLCHTIAHSNPSYASLGCLRDAENQYHIHPITEKSPTDTAPGSISLQDLLSESSTIRLTRRERYEIAFTIASSHLQLHDSPWLGPQWEKKDILFHRHDHTIICAKLYISRSFNSDPEKKPSAYMMAERGMSALGILLLELCFGVALEDHEIRKNFVTLDGKPNPGKLVLQ